MYTIFVTKEKTIAIIVTDLIPRIGEVFTVNHKSGATNYRVMNVLYRVTDPEILGSDTTRYNSVTVQLAEITQ